MMRPCRLCRRSPRTLARSIGAVALIGIGAGIASPVGLARSASTPTTAAHPGPVTRVIAHRGASGYLPEHTLEAYALAYGLGADMIEPDVVLSRDGVLICAHDLTMTSVTDVAQRFPERARSDGRHYWIDFTLAEIKTLRKLGRRSAQDTPQTTGYTPATLDEMLAMVGRLNAGLGARTGRVVGVIPEPKDPAFHAAEGQPIEPALVGALAQHGHTRAEDPGIIQCFDLDALERIRRSGSALRLVWLVGGQTPPTDAELDRAAGFCHGLGPSRGLLEDAEGRALPLLTRARSRGLALYPYTFKDEPDATARFVRTHRVDGLFTDFPDVAVRARDE